MKAQHTIGSTMTLAGSVLFLASGQALAQGMSASAAALLEEVVVTARRREESLEDLPLSVAAISGDAMQAQGIYDIKDITEFVPNVAFRDQDRRGRVSLFIRGIGTGGPGSFRPGGAGQYLDGHYMPGNNGSVMSTLDMERVEVLRGPQGTLFGKNTTGGAIQFVTAKPQQEFDADILVRAADHGQQDLRGMINIPINDTLATRIAIAKETSDGYGFNRNLSTDYGATDVEALSASLRWVPNDNWTIDFLFRGNDEESDQYSQNCTVHPTQGMIDDLIAAGFDDGAGGAPLDPFGRPYTAAPAATAVGNWGGGGGPNGLGHVERIYPGATLDFWDNCTVNTAAGPYVTSANSLGFLVAESQFYNLTTEWDSGGEIGALDNLNVKFIAGRRYSGRDDWGDRDATPLQIDSIGSYEGLGRERDTRSLEVIFTADVNDRVSFTTGVHSFDDLAENGEQDCLNTFLANFDAIRNDFVDDGMGGQVGAGNVAIPCNFDGGTQFAFLADKLAGGGPVPGAMSGFLDNSSIAVFGQVNWQINDNWALDLGARWTDEDRQFTFIEFETVEGTCVYSPAHYLNNPNLPRAPATGPANPGAPASTEICRPDYLLTFDSTFVNGFANDVFANFSEVTPMVSLTRTLAPGGTLDSGILYGTISEGFLTGAFNDELNVNLVPELAPLLAYGPEFVTNYEVGFKGTLADGRLRLATAIFYMDYTDKQEEIDIDNADGRFGGDPQIAIVTNAATVDIYGIELEMRAQPWDGGFLSVDVGWLESEYGQFSSFDPNAPGGSVDRSTATIEDYSPEWTVTASVEHAFLLGNGATLTPQLGMYWQSEYDFVGGLDSSTGESSVCLQDSFATFRFRATYEPADGQWQASLFGSNITDERYFNYCDTSRAGVYDYHYGRPDTWGAEFVYRWGG